MTAPDLERIKDAAERSQPYSLGFLRNEVVDGDAMALCIESAAALVAEVERLTRLHEGVRDNLTSARLRLDEVIKERDEARAEVERLRREVPSEHDRRVMRAALGDT